MTTFKIKRSSWCRGSNQSALLRADDKMCCLGFVCKQLGISEKLLRDRSYPNELHANAPAELVASDGYDNALSISAAYINDDATLSDSEREKALLSLFEKHGHELVFED